MPFKSHYQTFDSDDDYLQADDEDKTRDPYSSPVAVRDVAYSGKRMIGLDTSTLRPAKVQSVPTVRRLDSSQSAASSSGSQAVLPTQEPPQPRITAIRVTELDVPLTEVKPPVLPSEVSRINAPHPAELFGPDAPEYTLLEFRAQHFSSIHSKKDNGEPLIDLTQLGDEYLDYYLPYHRRMEMVALGLTYHFTGDAIESFDWKTHRAENL